MQKITLVLFLFITLKNFSQENYNSESYRVTLGDIETRTFKKDSTANAIVIFEEGNSYVHTSEYDLRTEEKHKIKILNREGFDNANITLYLYRNKDNSEKVKKIIATTYNKIDGKVIKTQLQEKDIFREKYNDNYTLVKFTLPNIKEGSVITYSYTIISPFMFKYRGWKFQDDIPKLYSEYRTSIPGNWLYNIKLVGDKKLTINESEEKKNCLSGGRGGSANCSVSRYAMKDVPAFIEEDYMTSESNYLIKIDYELKTFRGFDGTINDYTKTWKTVDKELRTDPNIGKQLSKSVDSEKLLSPEILNETDLLKKAKSIYKYVQENYTWNKKYRIFKNVSIKDLLKNKSGNVASINILLHNLLKENNINVKTVLVSTRENGFPTKIYPVISDFNYLIIQATINEKTYLLDATDNYLSFGDIPFRCLNKYGRLFDFKKSSEWIDLKPNSTSGVFYQAELQIDDNDAISGNVKSKRTGYHAIKHKKPYYANNNNNNAYLKKLENNFPNIEISDFEVTSQDKTDPNFKASYNIEYNYDNTGGNIYLNPFFVKFFKENPFKLQERTYPIDFGYKDSYFYAFKLNFNDNYTITETPKNISLSLPDDTGQILFSTKIVGNTINVMIRINFNKAIYEPEYYPYLKEFMNKIVNIQTNSLILLKKK